MKAESREPKSERNPKPETRRDCAGAILARTSGFRSLSSAMSLLALCLCVSCGNKPGATATAVDPHLKTNGTIEVTARLLEIPEGAIFKRELYDYATILKYQVLTVHRGEVKGDTLYVGHYNPFKPRSEAPDARVKNLGGNLRQFQAGQIHHLALDVPIDDFFMGGIINKYFGRTTGALYWAAWTDLENP
jgi:hypothetical protein